jgi:hypothetical protein
MSCLSHAAYNFKADIYTSYKYQDVSSGAIIKSWVLAETIDCLAKGIVRDTISPNASKVEFKEQLIAASNIVKIRTAKPISSNKKVVAIRNKDGLVWSEGDQINSQGGLNGATIFEPLGSTPILDFTGKVIEYEIVLQRQEIQSLELD